VARIPVLSFRPEVSSVTMNLPVVEDVSLYFLSLLSVLLLSVLCLRLRSSPSEGPQLAVLSFFLSWTLTRGEDVFDMAFRDGVLGDMISFYSLRGNSVWHWGSDTASLYSL